MTPGQDAIDPAMLALFKSEAESNSRALAKGLGALAASGGKAEDYAGLARAAQAIKGAAKIVGLDAAVDLARAIEGPLASAQSGKRIPDPDQMDLLLKGAEAFAELAGQDDANLAEWLAGQRPRLEELAAALRREPPAREKAAPEPEPEPAPEPEAAEAPDAGPELDLSMLELFKVEAENHSRTLSQGLIDLENSGDPDLVAELMRAAHSIKGAARIVGLGKAVDLAHAMEDVLTSVRSEGAALGGGMMDLLLTGTDVFGDISKLAPAEMPAWLDNEYPRLQDLTAMIRGEKPMPGPEAKPAGPKAAEPAPKAAPAPPKPEADPAAKKAEPDKDDMSDSVIRVSAGDMSRILSLSGECMVEAARLSPFMQALRDLKKRQRAASAQLERLAEAVKEPDNANDDLLARIADIQALQLEGAAILARHMQDFETYTRRSDMLHDRLHVASQASRMRPLEDGLHGFTRLVRDLARDLGKKARLTILGQRTKVDRDILEKLESPLTHLLRNAVDHGIETPEERLAAGKDETGRIELWARHRAGMLVISVSDDGRGVDLERIRDKVVAMGKASREMAEAMEPEELTSFLFVHGFSTSQSLTTVSGRGVGLDAVQDMINKVGGEVKATGRPGQGMTFNLKLPLTKSVMRTLVVGISGQPFAIPLTRIHKVVTLEPHEIELVEDRQYCMVDGYNVGLVNAVQLLELPEIESQGSQVQVVVIKVSDDENGEDKKKDNTYGLVVDDFWGEQDLVVRPLDHRLRQVADVMATARMEDGSAVLILDIQDLIHSIGKLLEAQRRLLKSGKDQDVEDQKEGKRILVVDDSLTVREVEKKLLQNHGYLVETAVDGMDGLNTLMAGNYDLVVTDVDMPRMDGISLVSKVKSDPDLKHIPMLIVSYKDREEDRMRGLEAGADYYLTKSSFHDETLLNAVADLIGEA